MYNEDRHGSGHGATAPKSDSGDSQDGSSGDEADFKGMDNNIGGKKRPLAASDDDKKAERRAANRRSAFQSRQRRKILIEDLQRTVAGLSKDSTDLRKSNEDLRVQLKTILLENHQLRMQQQQQQQQLPGPKVGAAELMQASALLRGGGQHSALSQFFGAGTGQIGSQASMGGASSGTNGDNDSLMNSRLALIAAHAKADDLGHSHETNTAAPLRQPTSGTAGLHGIGENNTLSAVGAQQADQLSAGLQSLLESAGRQGLPQAPPQGGPQMNALQSLLENAIFGGTGLAGGQLGGLSALLESAQRPPVNQLGGPGFADIQRAILSGASPRNPASQSALGSALGSGGSKPDMNEGMAISEALRNLLQKHHSS